MKTFDLLTRLNLFLFCVIMLSTTGCSILSVVTYPEAKQLPNGKLIPVTERLAEHGFKTHYKLNTGIYFSYNDLEVQVTGENRKYYPITAGPPYVPIVPTFWLDWFLDFQENKTLNLSVDFFSTEDYEYDPTKFVIVQDENEIKPILVYGEEGSFNLEYDTTLWEFKLKLLGIRNKSGVVTLPDVYFSRGSVWVFDLVP